MNKVVLLVIAILIIAGVAYMLFTKPQETASNTVSSNTIRYVALGDSYSIGQGVDESERWPNQLVERLRSAGTDITLVANPSRTGYTTDDLLSKEIPVLKGAKADFITIQIGVNDYFQGKDRGTFEQDFITVIEQVQMTAPSAKLLIVTIPDYGKTPAGSGTGNPDVIAAGVAIGREAVAVVSSNWQCSDN